MSGCLYMRGKTWWAKYSKDGKAYAESTKQTDRSKAEKFLEKRLAECLTNTFKGPKIERVRMDELAEDFLRDYAINGRKSLGHAESRWQLHLKPFFGRHRAVHMTSAVIDRYAEQRIGQGAGNATVNRELAALKRMFSLGMKSEKVAKMPYIRHLKEPAARDGFLSSDQYDTIADRCAKEGLWLRAWFEVSHTYGWRKSELKGMRVGQVNLEEGTIRLFSGTTKNDDSRVVKMDPTIRLLLTPLLVGKKPDDHVFTRENGKPVKSFRGAWKKVTAGIVVASDKRHLMLHDLRRTAAVNLDKAGVPRSVGKQIGGWKTDSMYDRYRIVDETELDSAMTKLAVRREAIRKNSYSEVTIDEKLQSPPTGQLPN
jgi:integrase